MDRIDICHQKYKDWCKKIGISTISDVNRIVKEGNVNYLVNVSEIWHEQNISEIANYIKENAESKKIILISGPSSSGKTSFANRLTLHLKVLGIKATPISLDNYYLPLEKVPLGKDGKPDFEAPEAIDYKRFNQNILDLISGKEAVLPVFNFGTAPVSEYKLKLQKNEVIIAEGLHALNPMVTENIPHYNKYKVYCSALTSLSYDDGTRIKSRTNRLIRRLIRDYKFRNSSPEYTFELWPNVEESSAKYIFPFTDDADVVFNSSLLYEFCVYKKHITNLLKDYSLNMGKEQIQDIFDLVNRFCDIDDCYVPKMSIAREFIGGSSVIEK